MQPTPFPLPSNLRHELVDRPVHPPPMVRPPQKPHHRRRKPSAVRRPRDFEHLAREIPQVRRVHVAAPPLRRRLDRRQHVPSLDHLHGHVQRAEVQRLARSLAHRRQRRADGVQSSLAEPRLSDGRPREHPEVHLIARPRVHLPVVLRVPHRGAHPRDHASRRGRVPDQIAKRFRLRRRPSSRRLERARRALQRASRLRDLVFPAVGDGPDDEVDALRARLRAARVGGGGGADVTPESLVEEGPEELGLTKRIRAGPLTRVRVRTRRRHPGGRAHARRRSDGVPRRVVQVERVELLEDTAG